MNLISSFLSTLRTGRRLLLAAAILLLGACTGQTPGAAPVFQVFEAPAVQIDTSSLLDAQGRVEYDHFSASIDIDGDLLVAGAPRWGRPPGEGTGTAYVFRRTAQGTWQQEATLTASNRDDGFQFDQHFGESVGISGGIIAVGAPGADDPQAGDNTGMVYIFEHDGQSWVETARLAPNRPTPGGQMGKTLAFSGDTMAVTGLPAAGNVYLFQRGDLGWRELDPLPVPPSADGKPAYAFLDLYGDTLAVSAFTLDPEKEVEAQQPFHRTGVVTLYERSGDEWKQTYQTPPQEAYVCSVRNETPIGIPVSLTGEKGRASLLAVGKSGYPGTGRPHGSVVLYERGENRWAPQAELRMAPGKAAPGAITFFTPDPGAAFFGANVDLEGDRLAVVSTFADAVYVFERQASSWAYQYLLVPGDGSGDDFKRNTALLDGDRLMLASPGDLGGGTINVFQLSAQ